jgi:multicomponent Na+:H+ antiporter subunit D
MMASVPPFAIFFLGALLVGVSRGRLRLALLVLTPVVGGINVLGLDAGTSLGLSLFDYQLTPFRVDRLSLLFGYLFHLAAFIAVIYSLHVRDTGQHLAALIYAGSALGAVFAGDLITLFVFWELLALSSAFLIWARRSERASAVGLRYLIVQVTSGVILLAGVVTHMHETGSLEFTYIGLGGRASWLIFLAFGIKCAFPLLHNWLTDAYPEATPTGTVFLSAFTTKVAVYALARGFPGTELLIYIGTLMTVFPIFYAVIENDLRRVLGYSMINQLGFMVVGVGIGTHLAINGAVSHAFNDVIFKSLLFMSMGAVLHMTGRIKGSELGGLYKTMPVTTVLCIVGAASISAFPLFSGFVSKSMVMAAALEEGYPWVWVALLFASAGVFHHAGIKIPFFAFFAHDSGIRVSDPPRNMILAMALAAAICVFNGSYPWVLYSLLPFPVDYAPYASTHVVAQLQLLFFSALAFTWLKLSGLYPPELPSVNIDAEWSYRWLLPRAARALVAAFAPLDALMRRAALDRAGRMIEGLFRHHGPQGILARTWPTGSMVLWVAVLLAAYLVFYYA